MIPSVESVRPESYAHALSGPELLRDTKVPVGDFVNTKIGRPWAHVADGERVGLAEGCGVEPSVQAVFGAPFQPPAEALRIRVGRLIEAAAHVIGGDSKGSAVLIVRDAVQHPSAKEDVHQARRAVPE